MNLLARVTQSLPVLILLGVIAVVVYLVVSWARSPMRAKEVLFFVFTIITGLLTGFFGLATLYALFEGNMPVVELTGIFLAISALLLIIVRVCKWRFTKNHPEYKDERYPTEYL